MRKAMLPFLLLSFGLGIVGHAEAQNARGPRYVTSEPARGDFLNRAPAGISITFSESLGSESRMSVSDACGLRVDNSRVALEDNRMQVGLTSRAAGNYTVSYVARNQDGSGSVRGRFEFRVQHGPVCEGAGTGGHHPAGGAAATPNPEAKATSGDALVALGLAGALGAVGGLILRASSER